MTKKIKLLCVVPNAYMGGLQIITLRLFANISNSIDPLFLLTRWTDSEFSNWLDELQISYEYSWFGMFSRKLDKRNLQMTWGCLLKLPTLYKDYLQIFRSYKPDVLYFASYHEIILLLPLLMFFKVPVVYHVHSTLPAGPFYQTSFNLWGRAVNHFIAVSSKVKDSINILGVQSDKISILMNAVDLNHFPYHPNRSSIFSQKFGWPQDAVIIGMTGQMIAGKGHNDFLEAAKIINTLHPLTRFIIGGKTDNAYYSSLKQKIIMLGLSDVVAFSGWQSDMSAFYSNLDVFVFPTTLESEGFGLVLIEAMASGCPVVATKTGGATEIIENESHGILIAPGKPSELVAAIDLLIQSPQKRKSLSTAGRKHTELFYTLSSQGNRFVHIINRVTQS